MPISDDQLDSVIQDSVRLVAEVRRLRSLVERIHDQAASSAGLRDSPLLAEIGRLIGTWKALGSGPR